MENNIKLKNSDAEMEHILEWHSFLVWHFILKTQIDPTWEMKLHLELLCIVAGWLLQLLISIADDVELNACTTPTHVIFVLVYQTVKPNQQK